MEGPPLSEDQVEAWLKLNALEFMPKRARTLLEAYHGDAVAVFQDKADGWRDRCPGLSSKNVERLSALKETDFSKERAQLDKAGAHIITFDDARYPANLRQLPDAPPVLLVRGVLVPEDKFSIAIVGSRRASQYGLSLARRFAADLAARGLCVVSGGARGVDTLAHRGALEAKGRTIAYLGCAVDTHCTVSPMMSWNTSGR